MIILQPIKEYSPIAAAFFGAFLAYILGNRRYRTERFYNEATDSLKDFYSPLYHEMRMIKLDMNKESEEELINEFLKKYLSISTQLYKSYNARLNELFYDLDDTFREYKIKKDNIILDKAINIFDRIFSLTKKEYDDIQKSLYKQYPWYKYLNQKSFIVRFLMDLSTLFYEACLFLAICWLLIFYMIGINRITGQAEIPNIIKNNFISITLIIIPLFVFSIIFRLPYFNVVMDYKKENKILKNIDEMILNKIKSILKAIKEPN